MGGESRFQAILGDDLYRKLATGEPNYNFAAVPDTFPHCRMKTDQKGEAVNRWFPDWKSHGAYVEIADQAWATAAYKGDLTIANDGAFVMPLKRRYQLNDESPAPPVAAAFETCPTRGTDCEHQSR